MAKIVSFNAFLRGTGRSHLMANLATLLAADGKRVGVIDLDDSAPTQHLIFGLPESAMAGQDAVLIALGTGAHLQPTTVLSLGTAHIVRAMETRGIRRVICLLSGWPFHESYPFMFRGIAAEHERQGSCAVLPKQWASAS